MNFIDDQPINAIPLKLLTSSTLDSYLASQDTQVKNWLESSGFSAKPAQLAMVPDKNGHLSEIFVGLTPDDSIWSIAHLPKKLPAGNYFLDETNQLLTKKKLELALIGWGLGSYNFDHYKSSPSSIVNLVWPAKSNKKNILSIIKAIYFVRDLINTPAKDLGPAALAESAFELSKAFGGDCQAIVGDDLLKHGYPAIHAIGTGAREQPRLIDLSWGKVDDPKITLIGKGVCFDTGGLNIKSAPGMKLMKKDMGGAANALGLSMLIMEHNLPIRLRTLIPAVENAVGPESLHPLDIVNTRNGLTIEIGHTDAEGRVILADALALAVEEEPELICDFATLTGAARIALGPDIPAIFCNNDRWGNHLLDSAKKVSDPLWPLPLWQGYRETLNSNHADISNEPSSALGGAITAGLFLETFVPKHLNWIHLDLMAWNTQSRPGRPEGGEAMGLRAFFSAIQEHFSGEEI